MGAEACPEVSEQAADSEHLLESPSYLWNGPSAPSWILQCSRHLQFRFRHLVPHVHFGPVAIVFWESFNYDTLKKFNPEDH